MSTPRNTALEALRHYAVSYHESAYQLARWMNLPTSDGNALGEIIWAENEGVPLSPAVLSRRIGLTSGATNALINRLEDHALVLRSRESTDRRIVTLRSTELARKKIEPFSRDASIELETALADYDDDTLTTISVFLDRLASVLPGANQNVRSSAPKLSSRHTHDNLPIAMRP